MTSVIVMQLTQLHDVELRLIMQFLQPSAKLAAVRTCRRMFHVADDRLAWLTGIHRLRYDASSSLASHLMHPFCLLRHANICIDVRPSVIQERAKFKQEMLRRLASIAPCLTPGRVHLHGVDLWCVPLTDTELRLLVEHPLTQCFRKLTWQRELTTSQLKLLSQLPQLTDLEVAPHAHALMEVEGETTHSDHGTSSSKSSSNSSPPSSQPFRFPSLTTLHVAVRGLRVRPDAACRLIACAPVLRHLSLNHPGRLSPHQWPHAIFGQLETITLEKMGVIIMTEGTGESAIFHQAFANLHSCHTLTLREMYATSALLPYLHSMPTLRHLVIDMLRSKWRQEYCGIGLAAPLRSLLLAKPHLHFTFISRRPSDRDGAVISDGVNDEKRMMEGWEEMMQLQQEMPNRIMIHLPNEE